MKTLRRSPLRIGEGYALFGLCTLCERPKEDAEILYVGFFGRYRGKFQRIENICKACASAQCLDCVREEKENCPHHFVTQRDLTLYLKTGKRRDYYMTDEPLLKALEKAFEIGEGAQSIGNGTFCSLCVKFKVAPQIFYNGFYGRRWGRGQRIENICVECSRQHNFLSKEDVVLYFSHSQ